MKSAILLVSALLAQGAQKIDLLRVPDGGIQPQVAVDDRGTLHLIYLKGDPAGGDVFYVRRGAGTPEFSAPIRVNSQTGSAVAAGTIRGAQLAIGRNGRVHVAWNGSRQAEPKGPGGSFPMLYARLNDGGEAFEPQRNVMRHAAGLDGGGTVAADAAGNVYVAWHGMGEVKGEEHRRVYLARSRDDGKTFSREEPAFPEATGACACCGMRAFADTKGSLYMLYRAATGGSERDIILLTSRDQGKSFRGERLHKWHLNACPMSSESIVETGDGVLAAWETEKQVWFARIDGGTTRASGLTHAPGEGVNRKHPVLAVNRQGETMLAWTEGTGWKKGGSIAWQMYDKSGRPTKEKGQADGLPVWSMAAVFARPDGGFTILY